MYKEFCIWEYTSGDIVEVLICADIDDGYSYEPNTEYYYVWDNHMRRLALFERNTTGEEIDIPDTSSIKTVFGFIGDRGEFNSSYVLHHRKVNTEYRYQSRHILPREELEFSFPT